MKYNYMDAMNEDIHTYICDNYTVAALKEKLHDRDEFEEELHDDLWVEDSVTGNLCGSYTCNTYLAEEYIAHNLDLLREALEEFEVASSDALKSGAEWCDVTIRCYLLGSAIHQTLDELVEELEG